MGDRQLFQHDTQDQPAPAGRTVGLVVNANVWSEYDYAWPDGLGEPVEGLRVQVPFGRGDRKTAGFVVRVGDARTARKLKAVAERIDDEPILDASLLEMGRWISRYYLAPLGLVLAAMAPSAVGRAAPKRETVVYLTSGPEDWSGQLGKRQRMLLDELLEAKRQGVEPVPLDRLRAVSGAGRQSLAGLLKRELVRSEQRDVVLPDLTDQTESDAFELNPSQQAVTDRIIRQLDDGFATMLLHGVTGSGKTEVYVRAIRKAIAAGGQAILLAPEIALATQTLERLVKRLPRVAVLHSGLTPAQRAFYHDQIRRGHASVVIGPRSAVFAPTPNLKLIIVDEEHEGSYKQDTAPRYHGRDVAIWRAKQANVPIVLGSATPSLESFHNVQAGKYELLELPDRVKGLPMPKLELVHLRQDLPRGKVELIGRTLTGRLAQTLDDGQQAILLMNRRGYASYVFCPSCDWTLMCDNCDRPLVYHIATQLALCHHCEQSAAVPEFCPACHKKLLLFGLGIQRIEDELARKFPQAAVARMDSDTMTSTGQFTKLLDDFRDRRIDILLGTQMVAKGLDFPGVNLVGVVSADTSLTIPDFRAAERTFQLVVQVAGRAGRAHQGGRVIVQTLHADEPAIQAALEHDYRRFAASELPARKQLHLPPYARIVRLVLRHEKSTRAEQAARELAKRLEVLLGGCPDIRMVGPAIAPIARLRGQTRWHILLSCPAPGRIQHILADRLDPLSRDLPAELIADVDPTNLG